MSYDLELAEREAEVTKLHQQRNAERTENLKSQLRDVRQKLTELRPRYAEMAGVILQVQDRRIEGQARALAIIQEISDHTRSRPECFDLLPTDPEVQAWTHHHNALIAAREKASAEIPEEPNRVPAMQLASDIRALQFAERNLVEALHGTLGRFPDGGLSGVFGG